MLEVMFLTPDSDCWDHHSNHHANEEEAFVDVEGSTIDKPKKIKNITSCDYDSNYEMKIDSCKIYS